MQQSPFADDFFAAIRAIYNARTTEPIYKRLTFILVGVARPAELIKDRTRTPYNIGEAIDLRDFTLNEAKDLLPGLGAVSGKEAEAILSRVFYWTGGHPYLTQKVCAEIAANSGAAWPDEGVDAVVKQLFFADGARKESNLEYINERIRESKDREKLLTLYQQALSGKSLPDEERDPLKSQLKLAGLLKVEGEQLAVRNRIYATVFDTQWVKDTLPKVTTNRITIAAIIVFLIAIIAGGYLFYTQQSSGDIQAQTFTEGFSNDQNSATVKISNLAGLFRLEQGKFADDARALFFALRPDDKQLTLFTDLTAPSEIGSDLQIVIAGLYSQLDPGNEHQAALLQIMADTLGKIESDFPDARVLRVDVENRLEQQ